MDKQYTLWKSHFWIKMVQYQCAINSATYLNTHMAVLKLYLLHEFMHVSLKLCNAIQKKALHKVSHGYSFQHCSIYRILSDHRIGSPQIWSDPIEIIGFRIGSPSIRSDPIEAIGWKSLIRSDPNPIRYDPIWSDPMTPLIIVNKIKCATPNYKCFYKLCKQHHYCIWILKVQYEFSITGYVIHKFVFKTFLATTFSIDGACCFPE